ncbi:MAG: DMT family transporter [Gaiellales bacterium]
MISAPPFLSTYRGAMLALVLGISIFSIQDPILKSFSGTYALTEAIAFRGVFALPVFTLLVLNVGSLRLLIEKRPYALMGRGILMIASYTTYYLSLADLQLATTVSLWFTGPLFMVALSPLIVGERQGWRRWAAVAVGLLGVIVIAHPSNSMSWAVVLPVAAAVFYAIGQLTARRVGGGIPAPVISWHQNFVYLAFSLGFAAILAPFVQGYAGEGAGAFLIRPWIVPTVHDAALLGVCGLIAGIGSTLIVFAYRTAGPGAIGALEYTAMLWAILWGWAFFGNLPSLLTLAGATLIIASGIYAVTRPAPEPHPRT